MPSTFQITVVTPAAEVLDRQVEYASIPAHDGQVGIAHLRAPLLTKLGYGKMTLRTAGSEQAYFIGGGFAQVKDDRLTVLTDEATPVGDLDAKEADAALSDALAMPSTPEPLREKREQAVDRARAMTSLAR
jgi:F-type H+-transporting ATPase subunit epsilon